jgi:hypothetical protein
MIKKIMGDQGIKKWWPSDHCPLYLELDFLPIVGNPVKGTVKLLERDLKLNDPCLIKVYQASLI